MNRRDEYAGAATKEKCAMNKKPAFIFTQILDRPARKLLVKWSKNATDYFAYAEELGCGASGMSSAWDTLTGVKEALYEPVGMWFPESLRPENTGEYAHGVELPEEYAGFVPEGLDLMELAPCKMLVFQGQPYADEEMSESVLTCMEAIETFNPKVYGYAYAPHLAPRMQLSPEGWRGYIEMRPIVKAE
jgi:hypothetical protein